jgi:alkyl hydroperoxide reductase subunit AhpC
LGCEIVGCSTDSVQSHKAWTKEIGALPYPLIGDTTHRVSRAYDVLIEDKGIALRGTVIIDPEGIIRYYGVHDLPTGRSVDEILRTLHALQTGELCPVNWKPGDKTLGKA